MLEKIYITEDINLNSWVLSYKKPEFQGGLSMTIDEKTAKEILYCQNIKQSQDIKLPGEDEVLKALDNIKI